MTTPADYAKALKKFEGKELSSDPKEKYREVLGLNQGLLNELPGVIPSIEFVVEKIDELIRGLVRSLTGIVSGTLEDIENWVLGLPVIGDIFAVIKKVLTGQGDIELPPILQGARNVVTGIETVLNQIGEIFHGMLVVPINSIVARVADWFNGLLGWRKKTDDKVTEAESNVTIQGRQIVGIDSGLTEVQKGLVKKVGKVDVPNNVGLWQTMNPLEDPTFPRILLDAAPKSLEANTSFENHNAIGTHRHLQMFSSSPFFTPSKGVMHFGFIRAPRNRRYNTVGFIVDAESNPCPMYVAVYKMRADGSLEMSEPSREISQLVGPGKSEFRLDLDNDISVTGGDYYAVGILQAGTGNVRRLASVRLDPIPVPTAVVPKKINATYGSGLTSPVDTISSQGLVVSGDDVLWMCLGETIHDGPADFLIYSDNFERSDADTLGVNWVTRATSGGGGIGVSGGTAAVSGGQDGTRTALWAYPLNYDDQTVSCLIGNPASDRQSYLVLRANNQFTRGVALRFVKGQLMLRRFTGVNTLDDIPGTTVNVSLKSGDRLELRARAWTYTILVNGAPVLTWQDSGTTRLTQRGPEFRFTGIALFRNLWANSTSFQSWQAADIPLPETIVLGMNKVGDMPGSTSQSVTLVTGWAPIPGTRSEVSATHELVIPAGGVIKGVEGVVWAASQTKQIQAMVYGYRAGGTSGPPVWTVLSPLRAGAAGAVETAADIRVYAGDLVRVLVAHGENGTAADRTVLGNPDGSLTHLKVWFQPDEDLPAWTPRPYPGPTTFPGPDLYPQEDS